MKTNFTQDMTEGSPTKLILKFSLPMLCGNIIQQLYYVVDSAVVGRFISKDALAAVGATNALIFLIIGLSFGLSIGISIVVSQYFGAKEYDNVRKGFASAIYIIITVSVIMGVVGFSSSRFLLNVLHTPQGIMDQANLYMRIAYAGILGISCFNGMSAILRAMGDSITPLIFLAISSVLNIGLDFLFVLGFHWGIGGAGLATVISQHVSAIGCIIYGLMKVKILRLSREDLKPDPVIMKKCIRLGLPVALQNSFVSVSLMAIQTVINSFNEVVIAACTASSRIEQLVLQPGMSVGAAVAAFTGQNMGAGNIDRVKKGLRAGSIIVVAFSLLMLPVIYFGGEYVMMLFSKKDDIEVTRIGMEGTRITCFFYSFVGMIFVTRNFLSGTGDVHVPMIMGFVEVVCRILFSNILAYFLGFHGIFLATGLNWLVTSMVGIFRTKSGKWVRNSLVNKAELKPADCKS